MGGGGGRRAMETSGEIFLHNTRDGMSQIQLCDLGLVTSAL